MGQTAKLWQIDTALDAGGYFTIRVKDATPHGQTDVEPIATVYTEQDAHLIAAAPALLAALQNICLKHADGTLEFQQAAKAIATATGETL